MNNKPINWPTIVKTRKGERIVFFTDEAHTVRDRGVFTGVEHRSAFGTYIGHEIIAHGRLCSIPLWRFVSNLS